MEIKHSEEVFNIIYLRREEIKETNNEKALERLGIQCWKK